jgi:hypothetical protein
MLLAKSAHEKRSELFGKKSRNWKEKKDIKKNNVNQSLSTKPTI